MWLEVSFVVLRHLHTFTSQRQGHKFSPIDLESNWAKKYFKNPINVNFDLAQYQATQNLQDFGASLDTFCFVFGENKANLTEASDDNEFVAGKG